MMAKWMIYAYQTVTCKRLKSLISLRLAGVDMLAHRNCGSLTLCKRDFWLKTKDKFFSEKAKILTDCKWDLVPKTSLLFFSSVQGAAAADLLDKYC
jgi:hypothetical protein